MYKILCSCSAVLLATMVTTQALAQDGIVPFASHLRCDLDGDGDFNDAQGSVTISRQGTAVFSLTGLAPNTVYSCEIRCALIEPKRNRESHCGKTNDAGTLRSIRRELASREALGECLGPGIGVADREGRLGHVCVSGFRNR